MHENLKTSLARAARTGARIGGRILRFAGAAASVAGQVASAAIDAKVANTTGGRIAANLKAQQRRQQL